MEGRSRSSVPVRGSLWVVAIILLLGCYCRVADGASNSTTPTGGVSTACSIALNNLTADPWSLFQMTQGSGKYPGDWGYVDTCQMVDTAHYCFLELQVSYDGAESLITIPFDYINTYQALLPKFNYSWVEVYIQQNMPTYIPTLEWGLCVPKSCSPDDVRGLFIKYNTNMNGSSLFQKMEVNCLPTYPSMSAGAIVMITLTALLGLLAIIGTSIDYILHYNQIPLLVNLFNKKGDKHHNNNSSSNNKNNKKKNNNADEDGSPKREEYQFLPLEEGDGGDDDDEMHSFINPGILETEEKGKEDKEEEEEEERGVAKEGSVNSVVFSLKDMQEMQMVSDIDYEEPFVDFTIYDDIEYLKEKPVVDAELPRSVAGFFMAWSVLHNLKKLFGQSTTQRFDSLNGMRVISMGWVILAHTLSFLLFTGLPDNIFYLLQSFQDDWEWQIVLSGFFAVDTFFFIAGFLVAFLLVKELVLKRKVNWVHYYVHRIWRICPVYFFVFLFYWKVTPYLSDGPKWKDNTDMKYCDEYWWSNLLYIQNLVPWDFVEECMGWSWYLAVDFQYYIFTPLLIYPFYRKKWLGWLLLGILLFGCLVINLALALGYNMTYWYGDNFGHSDFFNQIYTKPWARAYPYLVGIGLGFLLCERREQKYRPPTWLLILLVVASFAAMGAIVFGPYSLYKHSTAFDVYGSWSETENVSFITLSRLGWSLALAAIVYVCVKMPTCIIQSFLAHPVWIPLARITFAAYLIHPILLTGVYSSFARPFHYTRTGFAYFYVGHVLFAYLLALLCFLLLERPVMNLEKFLVPHRKRELKHN